MRFHMLQNVQMALDFLRYRKIKLVNIRSEDVVDGNHKYDNHQIESRSESFEKFGSSKSFIIIFITLKFELEH